MLPSPIGSTTGVLAATGVVKRFGEVTALDGIELRVDDGECVALVGQTGSGKTTLLRMFNRLATPDAGRIALRGTDLATLDPVTLRRGMGYVPQDGGLLPHWNVQRNVALVPWLTGDAAARAAASRALTLVGLDPAQFARRWPRDLSGGQRQRVALARAIAGQPPIILLDEPFSALDALTRMEMQELFTELRRTVSMTAVLVTHDLVEALRLADRVAVMRAGRIEQLDAPAALLARPATDYVRRLLAAARIGLT